MIAVLWTLSGLVNVGGGLYYGNEYYGLFQYLSNQHINPTVLNYLQWAVPALFYLNLALLPFSFFQFLFVYGLVTRKAWSIRLAQFLPLSLMVLGFSFAGVDYSAPPSLGVAVGLSTFYPVLSGLLWAFIFFRYLRRIDVKTYLNTKPAKPSEASGQSTLDVEAPQ